MRLAEHKIKTGIKHAEQYVRDIAVAYFCSSGSKDRAIMPTAIEALEAYGWQNTFSDLSMLESLTQTDETISWTIGELSRAGDGDDSRWREYLAALSWVLAGADTSLLKRRRKEIFGVASLDVEARDTIHERTRLLTVESETCWEKLAEFYRRIESGQTDAGPSLAFVFHAIEALARYPDKYSERALAAISREVDAGGNIAQAWERLFMIRLAGQMRLTEAIPHTVARLQEDAADWVHEECVLALTSIGGDEVIKAVWNACALAPPHFRGYAAWILESIHTDLAVEATLHLFQREEDMTAKVNLGETLLAQFAIDGVGAVRHFILNSTEDATIVELRNSLLATCTLMEAKFPELDAWRDQYQQEQAFRQQWQSPEFPVVDTWTPQPTETRSEARTKSRSSRFVTGTAQKRVGRNEPCPCNSGKKYKDCCMRRRSLFS